MGCEYCKMRCGSVESGMSWPVEKNRTSWKKWLHFWNCIKEREVVPIGREVSTPRTPPAAPLMKRRIIVVKPASNAEPPDPMEIIPPNVIHIESEKKTLETKLTKPTIISEDQPTNSETILADRRDSGIVMDTSTSSGCSFEVPPQDDENVPRKPPGRLTKLINVPKFQKSREQKMEELEAKLKKAQKRKQERIDKFNEHIRETNLRRETNKTVVKSSENWSKCSLKTKMLAKEAVAATIKQEHIQERLDKMKTRKERRNKVLQKKRTNKIRNIRGRISRQNRVAPLPFQERPPTTSAAAAVTNANSAPRSGENMSGAKAYNVYSNSVWDSMFESLT